MMRHIGLNFAHRGYSLRYPENTMLAFQKADEMGCDGFETDVQLSRDGEPVIFHDADVARTTSGNGLLKTMTYQELRQLDAGVWFDAAFAGQRILHLGELLDYVKTTGKQLMLELKNYDTDYPGLEQTVISLIVRKKMQQQVMLSSFNHHSMHFCKQLCPQISTALLIKYPVWDIASYCKNMHADALHLYHQLVIWDPLLMYTCRKQSVDVSVWTVDSPQGMKWMLKKQVAGIITNDPETLSAIKATL